MPELKPVWFQVEILLSDNISIIPVRDKDDVPSATSTRHYLKKTPYQGWKKYQTEIITKEELWDQMQKYNTTAVAMLCGKVSGNMEVIDLDVKWLPGIDARLFNDLITLYPDLYNRLRIHKSPSGGYHIIYRIADHVPEGNQKLASRLSTEKELLDKKEKQKCYIETRGEGGYVLAPPSIGYSIHQDRPIPVITLQERESIINLCRCYNQIIKIEEPPKLKRDDNYYDVNPFEHYNQSDAGAEVLLQHGWKQVSKRTGDYIHFNRPGSTTKSIHASFNMVKRFFHFFTTNTEFDPSKSYKPASVLAILEFNDDKKLLYSHLINQGYGQIKPEVEKKLAKQRSLQGKQLPVNASEEAKKLHSDYVNQLNTTHPHGIYWNVKEDGVRIDRERLYNVAEGLGFRLYNQEVVQIEGYFIHKRTPRFFFDTMKEYIHEEDADIYNNICNAYESFIQNSGKFTIERIPLLDESIIIKDTKQTCYKFYLNGYVFITSEKYTLNEYANLAGLIWYGDVQQRDFVIGECTGKYIDFLDKAVGYNDYSKKIIGYLSHNFKDETIAYIIVQVERCPDPRMGGGTGKNLFVNLLDNTTTTKTVPGSQIKHDEKFMQTWNGERVFHVSDVPKRFDYEFLKEPSSGSAILKKLFKDEVVIDPTNMCKFVISTQFSYEVSDGGLRRRLIPLEFTDFFTKAGGVDVHYGVHFPKEWDNTDWVGFDNAVASCVQTWLAGNLKLHNQVLSEGGWLKQFDQTYQQITREFIEQHWLDWVALEFVSIGDFNSQYETFQKENNSDRKFQLSSIKMNRALHDWASQHGYIFNKDVIKAVNGAKIKGKEFIETAPF